MGMATKLFVCHVEVVIFLTPANEVCEGYVFTGVCLSTGGGLCQRDTPPGQKPPMERDPLDRDPLLYGNVRAVCILLECILVRLMLNLLHL